MQSAASSPYETPQASGDRVELTQLPTKDPTSVNITSELGSSKALNFDLLNMVISFKRLAIYLEPITDTVEVLRYLLGWKMPLCSLLSCVLLNILFLTLSEGMWVSLLLLGLLGPAVLGYLGDHCQSVASEMTVQKKKHYAVQRRDLQTIHMSKQEALLEVKGMLKCIDDLLTQACLYAESMYKFLYWESHAVSSMFYGSLLIAVCLLYTAPVGLSLSVLNSALFLWNKDFCRVLLELKEFVHPSRVQPAEETEPSDPDQGNLQDRTPTPTSVEDLSPGNIEEAEEAEPDDEFKDAIEVRKNYSVCPPVVLSLCFLGIVLTSSPTSAVRLLKETQLVMRDDDEVSSGVPEFDTVSDNGLLSRNEPIRSKVSKLTEKLRKRVPSNSTGNCFQCNSAFSVLKKRRNCSNCGVSFCSRCCSYKVFRSTMGATAPEAQRETVFVCATCNIFLSSK
ncbi:protrudin-like isoform X1 [Myxocyprinus asiaticus]|uniref:protrudin-like isoform X1 n=1 Tax=Myxocyprinus asiaticus TaxID=70543 RepID=UPI002222C8C7|nr:protrudin-like isoform X1 [Myxocyprinus asiaticus]XP_051559423.1 protrudin-like isoform X1 [Myxocyprinus asiaticus]